jgi:hypothetical protein
MLEGKTPEARAKREEIDPWWAARLNMPKLSPRWVLQYFGTDVLRNHFHNDIWIASLEHKLSTMSEDSRIVISDARFTNELELLSSAGATSLCVKRGPDPDWWHLTQSNEGRALLEVRSNVHPSEYDWANFNFSQTIRNDATLEDLQTTVDNLIKSLV